MIDTAGRKGGWDGNSMDGNWGEGGEHLLKPREKSSAHQDNLSSQAMFREKHRRKGEARAPSRSWMKEGLAQEVPMKEKLLKTSPSQAMP